MNSKSSKQHSIAKSVGLLPSHVLRIVFLLMRNIGNIKRLRFLFNDNYPIEAPEVVFIGKVPDHWHVYSNGFICMSVLYDGRLKRLECCHERGFNLQDFDIDAGFSLSQSQTRERSRVYQKGWGKESKGFLLDLWRWQMLNNSYDNFIFDWLNFEIVFFSLFFEFSKINKEFVKVIILEKLDTWS